VQAESFAKFISDDKFEINFANFIIRTKDSGGGVCSSTMIVYFNNANNVKYHNNQSESGQYIKCLIIIIYIYNSNMTKSMLNKTELLAWLNSHIINHVPAANKI
jgi:hypothetical protein